MRPYNWTIDKWRWQRPAGDGGSELSYDLCDLGCEAVGLRLVTILPGLPEHPLQTIVHSYDADFDPSTIEYEALSYTWGGMGDEVPVRCKALNANFGSPDTWVKLTKNCCEAIRRLRYTDRERIVWIDAISIDQWDPDDRNHQVRRIHKIYQNARRVTVFLSEYNGTPNESWDFNRVRSWIFAHPYFRRIWIIQEVYWAHDIIIYAGDHQLTWQDLYATFRFERMANFSGLSTETLKCVEFVLETGTTHLESPKWDDWQKSSANCKDLTLVNLLQQSYHFDAYDSRDKLIAILSLAKDISPEMVHVLVDYRVTNDVLLSRLAGVLWLRHFLIWPAIESRIEPLNNRDETKTELRECLEKIDNLMKLSKEDLPGLSAKMSLRFDQNSGIDANQEQWRLTNSFDKCKRSKKLAQSPVMTLRELVQSIDEFKNLVLSYGPRGSVSNPKSGTFLQLTYHQPRLRKPESWDYYAQPTSSGSKSPEDTWVRVAMLSTQHFQLCIIPFGAIDVGNCTARWASIQERVCEHYYRCPFPVLFKGKGQAAVPYSSYHDFGSISAVWEEIRSVHFGCSCETDRKVLKCPVGKCDPSLDPQLAWEHEIQQSGRLHEIILDDQQKGKRIPTLTPYSSARFQFSYCTCGHPIA
jgi:hypothetical protein